MAINIDALTGLNPMVTSEVRMAKALRREQGAGDFFAMSTLKPVAQMGATMSGRATDAAKQFGVLKRSRKAAEAKALEGRTQRKFLAGEGSLDREHSEGMASSADARLADRQDVTRLWEQEEAAKRYSEKLSLAGDAQGHDIFVKNMVNEWERAAASLTGSAKVLADSNLREWQATQNDLNREQKDRQFNENLDYRKRTFTHQQKQDELTDIYRTRGLNITEARNLAADTIAKLKTKETNRHNEVTEGLTEQGLTADKAMRIADLDYKYANMDARTAMTKAKILAEAKANQSWSVEGGIKGVKPSAPQQNAYIMGANTVAVFSELDAMIKAMTPEQLDQAGAVMAPMLADLMLPASMERMVVENFIHPDPKVREYLTRGAKIENEFSRAMSGLAVTLFENSLREKWSPFVKGISQTERGIRMDNMQFELRKAMSTYEASFGTKWRRVAGSVGDVERDAPQDTTPSISSMSDADLDAIINAGRMQ